jgi:lipopolysaccharide transport system permease protein
MTSITLAIQPLKAVSHSRELIWSWTLRTIRARYQQSVLGWLWAIAQPAAHVAIFTLVFTQFVRVDTGGIPYILFSYVALTPWLFLSTALTDMCNAIVDNLRLVTKIYFPREILPIAAMLARLMDFCVASLLIVVLVAYYQVPVHGAQLALFPIVLAVQLMLTVGVGLVFAAANTLVRDVRPLLVLLLQVWFYLSPIIYPVTAVPERLQGVYALNPVVGIVEAHRAIWLAQPFPWDWLGVSTAISLASVVVGYVFFRKCEAVFADIG